MGRRGGWAMALVVGVGLGCTGLADQALDGTDVKASIKAEFVQACTSGAEGMPKKATEAACSCAADELLEKRSVKELMKLTSDAQDPKVAKEIAAIVARCAK